MFPKWQTTRHIFVAEKMAYYPWQFLETRRMSSNTNAILARLVKVVHLIIVCRQDKLWTWNRNAYQNYESNTFNKPHALSFTLKYCYIHALIDNKGNIQIHSPTKIHISRGFCPRKFYFPGWINRYVSRTFMQLFLYDTKQHMIIQYLSIS